MEYGGISKKMEKVASSLESLFGQVTDPKMAALVQDPETCNFLLGNPQDMPMPAYVQALQRQITPQNKDWFAYKDNEPESQAVVAEGLRRWRGVDFLPEDILLTTGAFAGLAIVLNALIEPGDEVIFLSPPWFFYESLIMNNGAAPVRVRVHPRTFDLDLEAIEAAITERTRAIIVNSPNNPTGKIYPAETLIALSDLLTRAQRKTHRPIYLLSDESYSRIIYDGWTYESPTRYYPYSFLIYTYGKTLLAPGERIGYIALPPEMPGRDLLRRALVTSQFLTAYAFPNAVLQYALADLDRLSIDVAHLQQKRDRMLAMLREMGYDVHTPEGTFYLLPRSPIEDDLAFVGLLNSHKILCLPGQATEMPGYFRISLTASDEMIERARPGFQEAISRARVSQPAPGI